MTSAPPRPTLPSRQASDTPPPAPATYARPSAVRGVLRREPLAAIELVVLLAGAAWFGGAVATGLRVPGLSVVWLRPALLGGVAAAVAAVAISGFGAREKAPRVLAAALWSLRPLWLAWLLCLALSLSPEANHYFVNWPRLQVAALVVVLALVAATTETSLLALVAYRRRSTGRRLTPAPVAALLFGAVLLALVGTGSGHLYTTDEWTIYATGVGLATRGVPAAFADQPYPLHVLGGTVRPQDVGPDGAASRLYGKYGVVQSLLVAPVYELAKLVGKGPPLPAPFPLDNLALPLVPLLLGPLVTAATAVMLFRLTRDFAYGAHAALIAALGYVFGSEAWAYSRTLLNMGTAALLLLLTVWSLFRARRAVPVGSRLRWRILAGTAAGLCVATRYETVLILLPFLPLLAPHDLPWRRWLANAVRMGASFALPFALVAAALVLGPNWLRSGSLLDFGYGGEGSLSSLLVKPWYGILGLTLSPGCGLVTHVPLMALGAVLMAFFWEDAPGLALASLAATCIAVLYYGSVSTTWCAFNTWGPRYLIVVSPYMALGLAALWQRAHASRNPVAWLIAGGAALWSLFTNALAVLIDFNAGWQDHWAHGVTYLEVVWLPFFSGITSHARLLRGWLLDGTGSLDVYWLYLPSPLGPAILVLLLAAALALGVWAWLEGYEPSEAERESEPVQPASVSPRR